MNKDLIFEELTISDEVINIGNALIKDIVKGINNAHGSVITNYVSWVKTIHREYEIKLQTPIFGLINRIYCQIYFFKDKEEIRQTWDSFNYGGTCSVENKTIYLTGYGVGKEIQMDFLSGLLYHELKHVYQESLYKSKELPYIFKMASNIVGGKIEVNNALVRNISYLLYFFNRNEINANMESIYQYLLNDKPSDIHNYSCPIQKTFDYYLNLYQSIAGMGIDDDTQTFIKRLYSKSFRQLMNLINFGITFYKSKERKVFARYHQTQLLHEMCKFNPKLFYVR